MAGFYASAIISYGKNKDGELKLMKHLTVPTLRFKPDLTESSFSHNFNGCAAVIKQKTAWRLRNTPRPSLSRAICLYLREQATKPRLSAGSLPPSISPRLSRPLRFFNRSDKPQKYEAFGRMLQRVGECFLVRRGQKYNRRKLGSVWRYFRADRSAEPRI